MRKILSQDVFFVEMLCCCLHSYNYFLLNCSLFRCRQADNVATVSSLVSLLPEFNYCRCHEIDENTGQGLITGVSDTSNKLSPVSLIQVNSLSPKVANISANFCKN